MKISDKINMNFSGLKENGAINIVALGDSVTHGAFAANEIDYESVYHNVLKKKINKQRNYVPVNVINSGIGGDTAQGALLRLDRDVFKYMPDLVIVCFGLNDINNPLKDYIFAMRDIFSRCKKNIEETIFLTPNMLNTYTAANTACENIQYSKLTAKYQNSGKMDIYIDAARTEAYEKNITVCDCYEIWTKLYKRGYDTTALLANGINHPKKSMHRLFANELFKLIFNGKEIVNINDSTMFRDKGGND